MQKTIDIRAVLIGVVPGLSLTLLANHACQHWYDHAPAAEHMWALFARAQNIAMLQFASRAVIAFVVGLLAGAVARRQPITQAMFGGMVLWLFGLAMFFAEPVRLQTWYLAVAATIMVPMAYAGGQLSEYLRKIKRRG